MLRCATLADQLRARGTRTRFVCREEAGHLIDLLRARNHPVSVLPAAGQADTAADDARATIEAVGDEWPDWMVVDHYRLDREWERLLSPTAGRLLVIDDLADREHDCDVLLDQNYSTPGAPRHEGLLPERCALLAGPFYALLRPEYAQHRAIMPPRDGTVRRVLVYFGGADPANMTAQAFNALCAPEFSHLSVDLVIGTNHPDRENLSARAAARPDTCVYGTRAHLADLMARADLAVGAGGVTTWERMCLGLPSLVVSIAENQRPTCEALGAANLIAYVGDGRTVGSAQIGAALKPLIVDRDRLQQLSSRGQLLVDGLGASRVADVLLGTDVDDLMRTRRLLHESDACPSGFDTFRFAWIDRCREDEVLALRNQPHVTAQMRSQHAITAEDHRSFLGHYPQQDRYDFVLIDASRDRYVGVFYVTHLRSSPEIGKYIGDSDYLGSGVASRATRSLLEFCRLRTGLRRLGAITRRDNQRNIALNEKLGFRRSGAEGDYVLMTVDL